MKTKHTEGPWSLSHVVDRGIEDQEGLLICRFEISERRENEDLANAHLISAAPELLMAAKLTYSMLEGLIAPLSIVDIRLGTQITDILRSMTAIIDKAEGRLGK